MSLVPNTIDIDNQSSISTLATFSAGKSWVTSPFTVTIKFVTCRTIQTVTTTVLVTTVSIVTISTLYNRC